MEILLNAHNNSLPFQQMHYELLLPFHALLILGLALDGGVLARFLSGRWLVFLGNASYSLYIIHLPIALGVNMIASQLFSTKLSGVGCMAIYVVATVCLSGLTFKFIEMPAHEIMKKKLNARFEKSLQVVLP
jgi:peptidoglycan/LPS O-acetylase OafA/YrhL